MSTSISRLEQDGDHISKRAVQKLNERHGWFQYQDAQSDVSNAFANNAVHAYLESAKEAQEAHQQTGFTPLQLADHREYLLEALRYARRFLNEDDHDIKFVDEAIKNAQGKA